MQYAKMNDGFRMVRLANHQPLYFQKVNLLTYDMLLAQRLRRKK